MYICLPIFHISIQMVKFHILFSIFITLLCSSTASSAPMKSIIITRTDGSTSAIAMENDMVASIIDGTLKLSCSKGDIFIPINEFTKWTYSPDNGNSDLWAGLEYIPTDTTVIAIESGRIILANLPAHTNIRLISTDGKTVFESVASSSCEIPTTNMAHGIYLLSAGNKTHKIALR